MTYPRHISVRARIIQAWRSRVEAAGSASDATLLYRSDRKPQDSTDPSGGLIESKPSTQLLEIAGTNRHEPLSVELAI